MKATLRKHKLEKYRGKFGTEGLETLVQMEASLCAAPRQADVRPWRCAGIHPLVYEWSRHTPLTVWIPRKPHPLGHRSISSPCSLVTPTARRSDRFS